MAAFFIGSLLPVQGTALERGIGTILPKQSHLKLQIYTYISATGGTVTFRATPGKGLCLSKVPCIPKDTPT
ncbi:hypothetical protein TUM17387_28200 [Shewanella carassii]|nr:hypothetical protein TUM17387_28200 [Shewanella carassii]